MPRGTFEIDLRHRQPVCVALDGIDAAGKTTLVENLCRRFPEVVHVPEFASTSLGSFLRSSWSTEELSEASPLPLALLYMAEFVERWTTEVEGTLARGQSVILDRGQLSKIAYQAALVVDDLGSSGASVQWATSILAPLNRPDLSIVLDVPVATAVARIEESGRSVDPRFARFLEASSAILVELEKADSSAFRLDAGVARADVIAEQAVSLIRARTMLSPTAISAAPRREVDPD